MTQTQQQAITEALRQALERLIPFVEAYRIGPGSNEREYEFVGRELNASRAALAALESAPVEPATAATGYPMAWGDGSGESAADVDAATGTADDQVDPAVVATIRKHIGESGLTPQGWAKALNRLTGEQIATAMESLPTDALEWGVRFEAAAEDAKPPACDCPARTAITEILKCPDGRSLTWPEIDEICRAALSAPCPTAELRDEIEQHNLWRAEAYRQLAEKDAEKDAEIARLKFEVGNHIDLLDSIGAHLGIECDPSVFSGDTLDDAVAAVVHRAETAEASLAALKQEAAEALEPFALHKDKHIGGGAFERAAALYERLKAEDPR